MSSPCIYMHLAGSANECQSPGPPDGCHRYYTVKYSSCPELDNFNFDARIDTTGAFSTDGVFIPCEDYFGDMSGVVTVADPDVGHTSASSPYCESNGMSSPCIYMHLAGSANECQSPGPPDGCHRYYTVKYS